MFILTLPTILGISLVLGFYTRNLGEIALTEMLIPLLVTVGTTLVITFILKKLLRNNVKTAIIASCYTLALFSLGHLNEFFHRTYGTTEILGAIVITMLLPLALKWKPPKWVNSVLVFTTLSMYLMPLFTLGSNASNVALVAEKTVLTPLTTDITGSPNIIYIVPDRYTNNLVISKYFHYDNNGFTDGLISRGFYVNTNARTNYTATAISLSTTLNLNYPNFIGGNSRTVMNTLQKHLVGTTLIAAGYNYYQYGSWWSATRISPLAPTSNTSQVTRIPEAALEYLRYSYLATIASTIEGNTFPGRDRVVEITNKQLDLLDNLNINQPAFVFTHILCPHPPIEFSSTGGVPDTKLSLADQYVEQLKYLNQRLLTAVDNILNKYPNTIIILMSDEGVKSRQEDSSGPSIDGNFAQEEIIEMHLGILMAVYYPDKDYSGFYNEISPVNVMRLILNQQPILDLHYYLKNITDKPQLQP